MREVLDPWASDPTLSHRDHLMLGIMSIARLDLQMIFFDSTELDDVEFPEALASIAGPNVHPSVRQSGLKINGIFGEELLEGSRSGSLTPQQRHIAIWLCVI